MKKLRFYCENQFVDIDQYFTVIGRKNITAFADFLGISRENLMIRVLPESQGGNKEGDIIEIINVGIANIIIDNVMLAKGSHINIKVTNKIDGKISIPSIGEFFNFTIEEVS